MIDAEVLQIHDDILCLRRPSYFNCCYMVRQQSGLVLIDAGMKSDGRDVQIGLDHFGATPSEIRGILLTHWHNDHSAGAERIRQESGAPVYYHRDEIPYFTGVAGAKGLRGWISDQIPEAGILVLLKGLLGEAAPHPVAASDYVRDGDRILDEFMVIDTPGHTPGHVAFFHTTTRTLFAGDALAVIDGEIRFMARPVTPDLPIARTSMIRALSFHPDMICPGHREPLTTNVHDETERFLSLLQQSDQWPLFG